jgi:regulator of protease activity HflC (stomatin/prohibitin superfamily)
VKVAPDYEKVVSAVHLKEAKILAARAEGIRTNALADAQAVTIVNLAESDRTARELRALSQAALFTNQIPAFQAAPAVYAQRAYLQSFQRATASARKYLLLTTNTHNVLTFDLQEKIREDILGSVPAPAVKTK